jgi:hypothetical protein
MVLLVAVTRCSACDTFEERYTTFREAEQAGAIRRGGWVPTWTPQTARDIVEIHNIDTNYQLLTYTFDVYATTAFLAACSSVEKTHVALPRLAPPTWWPPELRKSSPAPPDQLKFFSCRNLDSSRRYFVGIDEGAKRAFVWDAGE